MIKRNPLLPLFLLFLFSFAIAACGSAEEFEDNAAPTPSTAATLEPVVKDADSCANALKQILKDVNTLCADTGRGEVCYGHRGIEATPREGIEGFEFANVGDIEALSNLQTIKLSSMDLENNVWGVALMRLQANIPDAQPEQNLTFLLFGDVELSITVSEDDDSENQTQSFHLTTGSDKPGCAAASPNGLLVQTPDGVDNALIIINGMEVSLGSTVFLQAPRDEPMTISTIEGAVRVNSGGESTTAVAGSQIEIPLDDEGMANGEPILTADYQDNEDIYNLPVDLLDRDIEIAEALDDEDLELFSQHEELFDGIDVEDTDELFEYLDDNDNVDVPEYLINELGYTGFNDEIESYLENDLGYDLEEYDDYEGEGSEDVDDEDQDVEDEDDTEPADNDEPYNNESDESDESNANDNNA